MRVRFFFLINIAYDSSKIFSKDYILFIMYISVSIKNQINKRLLFSDDEKTKQKIIIIINE